jgi:hypothetical protein
MRGLDPRIRHWRTLSSIVIPAEAGIQLDLLSVRSWTPAFAGVTSRGD